MHRNAIRNCPIVRTFHTKSLIVRYYVSHHERKKKGKKKKKPIVLLF